MNATHESVIFAYSLNKTLITSSNIWNALSSTLELCERTQLLGPSYTGSNESMVIVEDTWVVSIKFELEVNFSIGTILEDTRIGQSVSTTDVASYLYMVKYSTNSFESNMSDMVPNNQLFIICPRSLSTAVGIAYIETMVCIVMVYACTYTILFQFPYSHLVVWNTYSCVGDNSTCTDRILICYQ